MSKSDLYKIFPLKVFMILVTVIAPLTYPVVLFSVTWAHYPSYTTMWDYVFSGLILIVPLIVGWMIYVRKRNKLLEI